MAALLFFQAYVQWCGGVPCIVYQGQEGGGGYHVVLKERAREQNKGAVL